MDARSDPQFSGIWVAVVRNGSEKFIGGAPTIDAATDLLTIYATEHLAFEPQLWVRPPADVQREGVQWWCEGPNDIKLLIFRIHLYPAQLRVWEEAGVRFRRTAEKR